MRLSAALLIALCPLAVVSAASECKEMVLVQCFIEVLDEWAYSLYELKQNVITVSKPHCDQLSRINHCISGTAPPPGPGEEPKVVVPHKCTHAEVVRASNSMTDLIAHRKNAGTFLKSYYLLTYACSPEGQDILKNHRTCLTNEKIGEMTLSAGTYLAEKFLDDARISDDEGEDDAVCEAVQGKLKEYMDSMRGICANDAAKMMCKSIVGMFKGLHADKLEDCDFDCEKDLPSDPANPEENQSATIEPVEVEEETTDGSKAQEQIPSSPEEQQGQAQAAASVVASLAAFGVALALRN